VARLLPLLAEREQVLLEFAPRDRGNEPRDVVDHPGQALHVVQSNDVLL
jgi:hypothetical protein